MILTLALGLLIAVGANAQGVQNAKGDWYVGTGDIANVSSCPPGFYLDTFTNRCTPLQNQVFI